MQAVCLAGPLGLVAGPILANRRQNTLYFYSVASGYATANRPAYDARRGYGGSQWLMSLSRKFTNSWVGAFVRYDSRAQVFARQPLVRQDHYASAGLAICWIIGRSATGCVAVILAIPALPIRDGRCKQPLTLIIRTSNRPAS